MICWKPAARRCGDCLAATVAGQKPPACPGHSIVGQNVCFENWMEQKTIR
jgi:hypothetical protein